MDDDSDSYAIFTVKGNNKAAMQAKLLEFSRIEGTDVRFVKTVLCGSAAERAIECGCHEVKGHALASEEAGSEEWEAAHPAEVPIAAEDIVDSSEDIEDASIPLQLKEDGGARYATDRRKTMIVDPGRQKPYTRKQRNKLKSRLAALTREARRKGASLPCNISGCGMRISPKCLHSHASSHCKGPFFRCLMCNFSSNHRSAIGPHMTRLHPGEVEEDIIDDLRTPQVKAEIQAVMLLCFESNHRDLDESSEEEKDEDEGSDEGEVLDGLLDAMDGENSRPHLSLLPAKKRYTKCALCTVSVPRNLNAMRMHISLHVSVPAFFKCTRCEFASHFEPSAKHHVSTHHGGRNSVVDESDKKKLDDVRATSLRTFPNQFEVHGEAIQTAQEEEEEETTASEDEVQMFPCQVCFCDFPRWQFRDHALSHIDTTLFGCSACSFQSTRLRNTKKHVEKHGSEGRWTDLRTPELMEKVRKNLKRCFPMMREGRGSGNSWSVFQKSIKRISAGADRDAPKAKVARHSAVPEQSKIPKNLSGHCKKCTRRTASMTDRLRHAVSHMTFRGFTCSVCNFQSKYRFSLMKHLRLVHGEKGAGQKLDEMCVNMWTPKRLREKHVMFAACFPECVYEIADQIADVEAKLVGETKPETDAALAPENQQHDNSLPSIDNAPVMDIDTKIEPLNVDVKEEPPKKSMSNEEEKGVLDEEKGMSNEDEKDEEEKEKDVLDKEESMFNEEEVESAPEKLKLHHHECTECGCGVRYVSRYRQVVHCVDAHLKWTRPAYRCMLCSFTAQLEHVIRPHCIATHNTSCRPIDVRSDEMKADLDQALEKLFPFGEMKTDE